MKRRVIFICTCDLFPYLSSTFKHNTVMIQLTENGSGLTLGWSGTPQFTFIMPGRYTIYPAASLFKMGPGECSNLHSLHLNIYPTVNHHLVEVVPKRVPSLKTIWVLMFGCLSKEVVVLNKASGDSPTILAGLQNCWKLCQLPNTKLF